MIAIYDEDGRKINRLFDKDGTPLEGTFISHAGFLEGVDLFPWGYEGMADAKNCDVYYLQDGTTILWAGPGEPNGWETVLVRGEEQ